MEKIKNTKILGIIFLSTIMVLTLVLGLMAVLRHNATVSSKVSFVATGVSGTIIGTVKSPTTTGFVGTSAFDTSGVTQSFNATFSPRAGTSAWNIGHLKFLPDINGVTGEIAIEFTITNTGTNTILATIPPTYTLSTETNLAQTYVCGEVDKPASVAFPAIQQQIASGSSWTFALNLSIINDAVNFAAAQSQIEFQINLGVCPTTTPGTVSTSNSINTVSSIIPNSIIKGQDYVAVLDFVPGNTFNPETSTLTVGGTPLTSSQYTWVESTKTLTIPNSVLSTLNISNFNIAIQTKGFANADGTNDGTTEEKAFSIQTPDQLSLLSHFVNNDNNRYAELNFKIDSSIEKIDLNPFTTFTFIEDTGLVEITQADDENGTNERTIYLGTGFVGETVTENDNTQFDTEGSESVAGTYYELLTEGYTEIDQTDATRFTNINNVITITNPASATKDLVLNEWTRIGSRSFIFKGNFNSNNTIINGMYINKPSTSYLGLFGAQIDGSISNTKIENGFILCNGVAGGFCSSNYGTIYNCSSDCLIISTIAAGKWAGVGGIVGANGEKKTTPFHSGKIENCANLNMILSRGSEVGGIAGFNYGFQNINDISIIKNCINLGNIFGGRLVGGITGCSNSTNCLGLIENCINIGNVTATSYKVAGITGSYSDCSTIKNSYNIGTIQGPNYQLGAILGGTSSGDATITGCGYLVDSNNNSTAITTVSGSAMYQTGIGNENTTGVASVDDLTKTRPLTEAQLKTKETYVGFDFDNVWIMDADTGYPTLRILVD